MVLQSQRHQFSDVSVQGAHTLVEPLSLCTAKLWRNDNQALLAHQLHGIRLQAFIGARLQAFICRPAGRQQYQSNGSRIFSWNGTIYVVQAALPLNSPLGSWSMLAYISRHVWLPSQHALAKQHPSVAT